MGSCMSDAAKVEQDRIISAEFPDMGKGLSFLPGALSDMKHVKTKEEEKREREEEDMEFKMRAKMTQKKYPSLRRKSSKPFDLFKQVSVTELVAFHNQIEEEYNHNPFVFQQYLKILAEFKSRRDLLERVRGLFKGHDYLIEMFEEIISSSRSEKPDAISRIFDGAKSGPGLTASEAVEYLDLVREQVSPKVFEAFVKALSDFKYGNTSREECISLVMEILEDHLDLALQFERFVSATT